MDDYPIRLDEIEVEGATVRLARIDQDRATFSQIAEMCGDFESIDKALSSFDYFGGEIAALGDIACYIVGMANGSVCKVGISGNPMMRLGQLQGGSAERLYFSHLFWMPRPMARRLERLVLDVMAYRRRRKVGEWIDATPKDAGEIVGGVLAMSNATVSNSAMFCQNLRNLQALGHDDSQHLGRGWKGKIEEKFLDSLDRKA